MNRAPNVTIVTLVRKESPHHVPETPTMQRSNHQWRSWPSRPIAASALLCVIVLLVAACGGVASAPLASPFAIGIHTIP